MTEWDRQFTETPKAFHAFEHYRDMPTSDRSIDAAYAEHQERCDRRQSSGKRAAGFWHRWSSSNGWVDRAAAHDADLSQRRRERRAAELEEAQDRAVTLARGALVRLTQRIQSMDVDEIPAAVLDRWLKTLTDVELRALGHQDKLAMEHTGPDGGPIQTSVGVNVKWHDPDPEVNRESAELGEAPS